MFLSSRQKSMRHEAMKSVVVDLNTGKEIPRVVWANDETGRYRQILMDPFGRYFIESRKGRNGCFPGAASKVFTGSIKIMRRVDEEQP